MKRSKESILSELNRFQSEKTRSLLLEKMEANREQGLNCLGCLGYCCTMQANSMKITPRETIDLLIFLLSQSVNDRVDVFLDELKEKLKENIEEFRLDRDLSIGKTYQIRRYYTCPFYLGQELGCSIDFKSKPYGCLAFEPRVRDDNWKNRACRSDIGALEASLNQEEEDLNHSIQEHFQLTWKKLPIPLALMDILGKVFT